MYYLLYFGKCFTFFHDKKFVIFLFVSLEGKKTCSVLNAKMRILLCYNKTNEYTKVSMPLSQNILYFRLPFVVHLINILSNLMSLNQAQVFPGHIAGPYGLIQFTLSVGVIHQQLCHRYNPGGHHIVQHLVLDFYISNFHLKLVVFQKRGRGERMRPGWQYDDHY